jgi:hypothetical protein
VRRYAERGKREKNSEKRMWIEGCRERGGEIRRVEDDTVEEGERDGKGRRKGRYRGWYTDKKENQIFLIYREI